ncbi:zinc finger and BTB domain-containing protein 41-like isoform X1 [Bombyx mandarina]|uniref:Zinc finger and BTB domain-containing protein 41-like isoform X1 n=1 Tax=Bombyx mandarina TaxID=7092 RepID=A0A6J2KHI9_BOMMA|nr:zinc finger and BTB domain-containing protein 41-like isoform X1 [Bombyx mandarina]
MVSTMASFLCFVCHSTINSITNEVTREKYREVIGMNLCQDSHLCHICRHILNKLWLFRSKCLKRSSEYPSLFSEDVPIRLQRTDTECHILCPKSDSCQTLQTGYSSQYVCDERNLNENRKDADDYHVHQLQDERNYIDYYEDLDALNEFYGNDNPIVDKEKGANALNGLDDDNIDGEIEGSVPEQIKIQNEFIEDHVQMINDDGNEGSAKLDDTKTRKVKNKRQKKILTDLEEQKAVLDAMRKGKKYLEAEFKCYNCAVGFLFKDTYQAHMMRHEESNGEYRCEVCTLRFACASVLRAHSKTHSLERSRRRVKVDANGTQVPCHLCGRIFMDTTNLKQHLKRFHNQKNNNRTYSCSVCGKSYSNQGAVRTHMIKHINRKFNCDKCPSTFSSPYTLNQHKKKHDDVTALHHCETCDVTYNSRKSLMAHKRNTFAHQQTVFACRACNRLCPTKRSLESHMAAVHSATKDFCCEVCDARYTNRKSWVRHVATHDPSRAKEVFICYRCPKTFKSRSMLTRHLKKVCEKEKLIIEENNYYQENVSNL